MISDKDRLPLFFLLIFLMNASFFVSLREKTKNL